MDNAKRKAMALALIDHTKSGRISISFDVKDGAWKGECGNIIVGPGEGARFDGPDEVLQAMTEIVAESFREAAAAYEKFSGLLSGEQAATKPTSHAITLKRTRKAAAQPAQTLDEVDSNIRAEKLQAVANPSPQETPAPPAATTAPAIQQTTGPAPVDAVLGKDDLWPGDKAQAEDPSPPKKQDPVPAEVPAAAPPAPQPSAPAAAGGGAGAITPDMPDWEKSIRGALHFKGAKPNNEVRKLALDAAYAAHKAGAAPEAVNRVLGAVVKEAIS